MTDHLEPRPTTGSRQGWSGSTSPNNGRNRRLKPDDDALERDETELQLFTRELFDDPEDTDDPDEDDPSDTHRTTDRGDYR